MIKIHYDNQSDTFKLSSGKDLEIDNIPRHQEHKLSLVDIGIGMTKADLTPNLGAIAKPGTKMFVENLQPSADMSMIGAGFVSAYLVVQKVVVITKQKHELYSWSFLLVDPSLLMQTKANLLAKIQKLFFTSNNTSQNTYMI